MYKKEDILNAITDDFVEDLVNEFGGQGTWHSDHYRFQTVCHGGDSHKLYWYPDSKRFVCYTNCGSMDIFAFVMKAGNMSFPEAMNFLGDRLGLKKTYSSGWEFIPSFGKKDSRINVPVVKTVEDPRPEILNAVQLPELKEYDESILKELTAGTGVFVWQDEGISVETMKRYQITWTFEDPEYEYSKYRSCDCDPEDIHCAILIPHRDINGRFIGLRRRTFIPCQLADGNKYMPVHYFGVWYAHATSKNLYGIYQNQDYIRETKTACIFEGEKSVLLMDTFYDGKSNAVATCGFNVSLEHLKMLQNLGVDTIYLCYDKDYDITLTEEEINKLTDDEKSHLNDFRHKLSSICRSIYRVGMKLYIICDNGDQKLLGPKDAPVDKGKEVFEQLKNNAVLYTPESAEKLFGGCA